MQERRRKKLQKRIAKQKEAEAEKERDKHKWKHWSTKASGKKLKGVQKKMLQKETRETVGAFIRSRRAFSLRDSSFFQALRRHRAKCIIHLSMNDLDLLLASSTV